MLEVMYFARMCLPPSKVFQHVRQDIEYNMPPRSWCLGASMLEATFTAVCSEGKEHVNLTVT